MTFNSKHLGVTCGWCKQGLISLYTHDFHYCFCGGTFVDGGTSYLRCGWEEWAGMPETFEVAGENDGRK